MNPQAAGSVDVGTIEPIELKAVVPCPPDRAFDYFTRDIGRWWPLAGYSCGEENALDVRFEPRVRGGIIETTKDGTTHRWGTVTDWQPGVRVAFSWHAGRDDSTPQWVEVTFTANAAGTLVALTHGGFETLGERGFEVRTAYANGWPTVFGQRFVSYCTQRAKEDS